MERRQFFQAAALSATTLAGCGGPAEAVDGAPAAPAPLVGTAVYRIENGRLDATWTVNTATYAGRTGTEVALRRGPGPLAGDYDVEIFDFSGASIFKGLLRITQVGPTFQMEWTGPGHYLGQGLLAADNLLAASYWKGP